MIAPFFPVRWPFLTLLRELDNVHPAVVLENKGSSPAPMDDSSSSRLETGDESIISATEHAESALEVTACCCVFDELLRARWRRVRPSALVVHAGACPKQRLESLPSVLFCDMPPQSTPHQRHCRQLIFLPSRPHQATLEAKHAAAREVISAAYSRGKLKCSRRKFKPLLGALGTAAQLGLTSDDDAVAKGKTLKVSCDRQGCIVAHRSSTSD